MTKIDRKDAQAELVARLKKEGMTIAEFARMWEIPPWQASKALRDLERKDIITKGTTMREFDDGPQKVEVFVLTQNN